jgi:hypothetical protein
MLNAQEETQIQSVFIQYVCVLTGTCLHENVVAV